MYVVAIQSGMLFKSQNTVETYTGATIKSHLKPFETINNILH